MSHDDEIERARERLWIVRKILDETPAGGTIAPDLRDVYHAADVAYGAIMLHGDIDAAYRHAQNARSTLMATTIDGEALARWLHVGLSDGDERQSWRDFVQEVHDDLDTAVNALAAALEASDSPSP